jgi:glycosyltransferase involved in cell wall biosynthesis
MSSAKVLQIHCTDSPGGGGPIAMLRLQDGVRKAGVHSTILCANRTDASSVVIPWVRGESRLQALTSRMGFNDLHGVGSFKILNLTPYAQADLLHIHCLHGGFFNPLALPLLTRTKPAIYTLHDMWPFTGHCVYSFDCERWKSGCGRCPYPDMPNAIRRDATRWEWKFKQWSYRRSNLTVVAPSKWIFDSARQSMFKDCRIEHIPYGVDTDVYRPLDQERSRADLGIPAGKNVLLYMVRRMDPSDKIAYIKGADLLVRALQDLPLSVRKETVLLLVGEGSDALAREVDMAVISLGFVSSDPRKAMAYSAADLFVFPTRADNLPLVLLESMACGTPMVSFQVGGVPDLVRPGVTGFLAEPEDPKGLSAGIVQLLEDGHLRARLRSHCRDTAVKEYSMTRYIDRHLSLYRDALDSLAA